MSAAAFWGPINLPRTPVKMPYVRSRRAPQSYVMSAAQVRAARAGAYRASARVRALQRFRAKPRIYNNKNSGELRGMDTSLAIATPVINTTGTNGDIITLNLIEAGNGSYNRNGRKAFLKSVRLSGLLGYSLETAATSYDLSMANLRMVVVWDKQPSSGTVPTFDTIFGYTTQDGTEGAAVTSHLRFDNTGRFQVLKDVVFAPPAVTPSDGAAEAKIESVVHFDEFIDLKNRTTIFSGDSDPVTIADISSGALYCVFRSLNTTTSVKNDWTVVDAYSRLRFTC